MDVGGTVFHILEIIGIFAFAVSGAMTALKRKLDVFGVIVIGIVTALGGGVTRDIFLGYFPPRMFENFLYTFVAAATALTVFTAAYIAKEKYFINAQVIDSVNIFFDALGLGVFSVLGVNISMNAGHSEKAFLCIFLGTVTGVGGGILRDIMSSHTPMIFQKRIYAVASIVGSALYYIMKTAQIKSWIAVVCAVAVTFILRILATLFKWSLPRVKTPENVVNK